MTIKVILILSSFALTLPASLVSIPATSSDATPPTAEATARMDTSGTPSNTGQENDTRLTQPTSPPSPPSPPTSHSSNTHQPHSSFPSTSTNGTTAQADKSDNKFMLFMILLAIVMLMVLVGCVHAMRKQHNASRMQRGIRGLRAWIARLWDRMGTSLCPGWKTGEEEQEAEPKQGDAEMGGAGESKPADGGTSGNEDEDEHKEEGSDASDDYSSLEGDNLRERALARRQEEEERGGAQDGGGAGGASEEGQSDVDEGMSGDAGGGSEDKALVSPRKEAEAGDVTFL